MANMRESKFVEQNKDKWARFEEDLNSKKKDPQVLRAHLIQITDDLSYSRTFYRNRSVRIYLNGLAQQVYHNIYKNRRNFLSSLKHFYLEEIPRLVYFCRKELLVSFLVLSLSVLIGMFSSAHDEGFARSILGDAYVEITLENIKNGDPMGIYKSENQMEMFFQIAANNLYVSLLVFLAGILASYGALFMLFRNGIMLGVFMYFFYTRNLATEFNLTVWMHGTIEILTLVLETVAGMLLGRGLIYPGTLSRSKAFSVWGKRGAMLFLALVPFILFAAIIESFLTRYTGMPNLLRIMLIVFSLVLMLYYFVFYPYHKFGREKDFMLGMPELEEESELEFDPYKIYSNGQIFLKTIQLFSQRFGFIIRSVFGISSAYLLALIFLPSESIVRQFKLLETDFAEVLYRVLSSRLGEFVSLYKNMGLLFNPTNSFLLYILSSVWMALLAFLGLKIFVSKHSAIKLNLTRASILALVFSLALNSLMLMEKGMYTWIYLFLSPFILLAFVNLSLNLRSGSVLDQLLLIRANGLSRMFGLLGIFLLVGLIGMILIISPFAYLGIYVMEMNINLSEEVYTLTLKAYMLLTFILLSSLNILFFIIQTSYLAFTLKEINEAEGLVKAIQGIGQSKKTYGIETE